MDTDLIKASSMDAANLHDSYYIGEASADTEWKHDPVQAQRVFLQTIAYRKFNDRQNLILLGRTGTGKTAIMRCLEKEVNDGCSSQYDFAAILQFSELLLNLDSFDQIDSSPHTFVLLKQSLKVIISMFAMQRACDENESFTRVRQYLSQNGLTNKPAIWSKIKQSFSAGASLPGTAGTAFGVVHSLSNMIDSIANQSYEEALRSFYEELGSANILVLVDTMENYDIRDLKVVILMKAIISACFEFSDDAVQNHVYVKLSLPSEIYTHILEELPGKMQGNTVAIQWKYKDLVSFLSLRIFSWALKCNYAFAKNFKIEDFYSDNGHSYENSCALISNILPEFCKTSSNFEFNTISYCIRHTLRKPRELLFVFNTLIEKIVQSKNLNYFYDFPNEIRDVIHSCEERLINTALSMYPASYPQIAETFSNVLSGKNYLIKGSELIDSIKATSAYTKTYLKPYDSDDIVRLLFETGFVGKVNKKTFIKPNSKYVKSSLGITIVSTLFEYQIKGGLRVQRNEEYIIHPMCYEHYGCYFSKDTFVYPETIDDDTDLMCFALRDPAN